MSYLLTAPVKKGYIVDRLLQHDKLITCMDKLVGAAKIQGARLRFRISVIPLRTTGSRSVATYHWS